MAPDGNVVYLQGKHIPLFMTAIFVLTVSVLCATAVLLTQCLQRWSWHWLLSWFWRIKPILDAYGGPYKDKYRFWAGLLLRICLFLGYAVNTLGDKNLNLLLTTVVIACILCLKCTFEGIYRNWILDILENIFLVNLITFSAVASYIRDGEKLPAVTNTSIGIAFLIFL